MRDAVDAYGYATADSSGWQYVDRLSTAHGDYRRAYFTLVFVKDLPLTECNQRRMCWKTTMPFEWNIEARVVRCGPGWYVVSTPLDLNGCSRRIVLPPWTQTMVRSQTPAD